MAPVFKTEELDQIVAPIALYPDELLAQVLMASTYASRAMKTPDRLARRGGAATYAADSYRVGIRGGGKTVIPTPGEGRGVVSAGASSELTRSDSCRV
jgi:Protein of unknown function (DUF3300)